MIVSSRSIEIAAPAAKIYALAAATERWPRILPHYRFVHVLQQLGRTRILEMAAWRDWIPLRWTAEQIDDPQRPTIRFRHLQGWTRGMEVEWRFEPAGSGTRVTIEHCLQFQFPFAAEWLGRHVVCNFFIDDVAGKTLARMKYLCEAE